MKKRILFFIVAIVLVLISGYLFLSSKYVVQIGRAHV